MTATSQIARVDKREGPTPDGGLPSKFTRLADGLGPKVPYAYAIRPNEMGPPLPHNAELNIGSGIMPTTIQSQYPLQF